MRLIKPLLKLAVVASLSSAASVSATSAQQMLESYRQQARAEQADFVEFSSDRGRQFFNDTHAKDWSCATCHTADPAAAGRHDRTAKAIEPLAPAANSKRFTPTKKTEKWFRRNCKDVLERECTASEKGDVISYLLSVKKKGYCREPKKTIPAGVNRVASSCAEYCNGKRACQWRQ